MSYSSVAAAERSRINLRNEEVWEIIKFLGGATNEEVIDHLYPDFRGNAKEGKRLAQPIYRATSEGAKCGALLETEQENEETGYSNTRYTFVVEGQRVARPGNSYKERYLALVAEYEVLKQNTAALCRDCSTLLCRICVTARKKAA